jgi:DHA1 family tetracycline resistance protein-like MFS transporter
MALGAIVAPLLFNPLLAWFTSPSAPFIFWGAAFAVAATFAVMALIVLSVVRPTERR